jgi:glycerophosphoryl diester phosphodiesterase
MARSRLAVAAACLVVAGPVLHAVAAPRAAAPARHGYVGDFDGDGRSDVYWAVPGPAPDEFAFGAADGSFEVEQVALSGAPTPVVGDFDGDGAADVVQYVRGGRTFAWYGGADRGMTRRDLDLTGAYRPVVGDFDGDKRSDVLWFAGRASTIWYGAASRRFVAVPVTLAQPAAPYAGDFDGDGRTDLLWPGSWTSVWYAGTARGAFVRVPRPGGTGRPVIADLDGDGTSDVRWSGHVLLGLRTRSYRDVPDPDPGAKRVVPGDFDGDHVGDLLSADKGRVLYGTRAGVFLGAGEPTSSDATPLAGDFDGDRRTDLWWPDRGYVWRGSALRHFARAAVTTAQNRVDPLRPDVWAKSYAPYGGIAHAMGGIDGVRYTNSLEAFEHSYAAGFRVFEADFVRLRDGTIYVGHEGMEPHYGLAKPFERATYAELRGHRVYGKYTPLTGLGALALLRAHRDGYVVIDTKANSVEIITRLLRAASGDPQVARRLLPHVADQRELDALRRSYPVQHYLLALYQTQWAGRYDDAEALAFVRRNHAPAVMMWFRERDPTVSLVENDARGRRYTASFAQALRDAGAVVYVHSTGSADVMRPYADAGIGVYSDGPFPAKSLVPPVA